MPGHAAAAGCGCAAPRPRARQGHRGRRRSCCRSTWSIPRGTWQMSGSSREGNGPSRVSRSKSRPHASLACTQPNRPSCQSYHSPRPGQSALSARKRACLHRPDHRVQLHQLLLPQRGGQLRGRARRPNAGPRHQISIRRGGRRRVELQQVRCRTTSTSASGRPPVQQLRALRRASSRESTWTDIPKVATAPTLILSSCVDGRSAWARGASNTSASRAVR